MNPNSLWLFLPFGYLLTILLETPVLLVGLSSRHSIGRRFFAGAWLTACTYPIVVIVLPILFQPPEWSYRDPVFLAYIITAETFAPVAECAIFWMAFGERTELWTKPFWRDMGAIVLANLVSFGVGEALNELEWFPRLMAWLQLN